MRLRPRHAGLLAMLAVAVSGCGSGGSSFPSDIPSQSADGLLAYLDSVKLACQNGDQVAVRNATQGFVDAVDSLPGSVDSRVRTVLRQGADNLTRLARDPGQCATGATGTTGQTSSQPETTTTTPTTAATTTTTKSRSTTTEPTTSTETTTTNTTSTTGGTPGGTTTGGGPGGSTTGTVSPPGGSGGVGPGGGGPPGAGVGSGSGR